MALDYQRKDANVKQWPEWLLNHAEHLTERETFAAYNHCDKDSELQISGLLGPVRIIVSKVEVFQ